MSELSLRARLNKNELLVGTMVSEFHSPPIARMLATAHLDFFIIDMEHGSFSWDSMHTIITVARACGIAPVVRIPEIRRETILKPLDAGAAGLLVPIVETVDDIHTLLLHMKYPPAGLRGAALRRGHSNYKSTDARTYMGKSNAETALIIQIETRKALDSLEDLIAVQGVDAAFVGPLDLSVDLGLPGQTSCQEMEDAYNRVNSTCRSHQITSGIQLFDLDHLMQMVKQGMRFISYSSDVNLIIDHLSGAATLLRKESSAHT